MTPIGKIKAMISSLTADTKSIAYTCLTLGLFFCAIMIWNGSEENAPRFKKAAFFCCVGIGLLAISTTLIAWIKTSLT